MGKIEKISIIIFGIFFFFVGICTDQFLLSFFLGVLPVIFIFVIEKEKQDKVESSTKKARESYNKRQAALAKTSDTSCCCRCGVNLSTVPREKRRRIGGKKYCDVCEGVILKAVDNMQVKRSFEGAENLTADNCPKCGAVLSALPAWKVKKIGKKKYCEACHIAILCAIEENVLPLNKREKSSPVIPPRSAVKQNKPTPKKFVCARCKVELEEGKGTFIGDHRFCEDCARVNNEKMNTATETNTAQKPFEPCCSMCHSLVSIDKVIFADGKYFCKSCFDESCKKAPAAEKRDLCKVSYEMKGLSDYSHRVRISEICERLLDGGFSLYEVILKKGSEMLEFESIKDAENDIYAANEAYAVLSRGTLRVAVISKEDLVQFHWTDDTEKAFKTTAFFVRSVAEEVFDSLCTISEIEPPDMEDYVYSLIN